MRERGVHRADRAARERAHAQPARGTGARRAALLPRGHEEREGESRARRWRGRCSRSGPRVVVLTGGHRSRASDLFLDSAGDGELVSIDGERHPDGAAHGSGCTHSSVLAAQLALGRPPLQAARAARALAGEAVGARAARRGRGAGAGGRDRVWRGCERTEVEPPPVCHNRSDDEAAAYEARSW